MKITKEEIAHVALLARLEMSAEEMEEIAGQLNNILEYVDKLNRLDTAEVPPTTHVLPLQNVFREDRPLPCLTPEAVQANAPEAEDGMFRIPPVIE
ncbi:MAG TPA: Asp-tRNA(Asn)/Glu-tRNA(Gln) amidotransferase subunit GatC [Firmicutes bacterium]|nr:Asp-tRNA(Asn)/Glu-tRNA(Gln) amidotransferase subunit GatC [Bacillota bacterium]